MNKTGELHGIDMNNINTTQRDRVKLKQHFLLLKLYFFFSSERSPLRHHGPLLVRIAINFLLFHSVQIYNVTIVTVDHYRSVNARINAT